MAKVKHRHEYWVIFPQRVDCYHTQDDLNNDCWHSSSSMMRCKTIAEADKLMQQYNGAYYAKVAYRHGKRYYWWIQKRAEERNLSEKELYDKYSKYPSIKLIKE